MTRVSPYPSLMLAIGDEVPDFTLPLAFADGRKAPVAFSSLLGKGPVVLSFFPLAFTRVCTTQMCDARDHAGTLRHLDAEILGFSCDTVWTNVHFAKELDLKHGIFSDANREVVDRIWASQDVAGVKRVPKRGWMVVTRDGRVAAQSVTDVPGDAWVGTKPIEAALAALR